MGRVGPRSANSPTCAVKGCPRARYKGELCRKHHALVPLDDKMALCIEIINVTHRLALRHHRRWRIAVQRQLDAAK